MVRNGIELLAEMSQMEDAIVNGTDLSVVIRETEEMLTSTLDTANDVPMTAEMVPVMKKGDKYYVDFTSVYAAANDMGADIGAIMNQIMDVNSSVENVITPKNLILTVESADYFRELIEEAKCGGKSGKRAKSKLQKAVDTIKAMKKAGIKVEKKKSKKKKKKSTK